MAESLGAAQWLNDEARNMALEWLLLLRRLSHGSNVFHPSPTIRYLLNPA